MSVHLTRRRPRPAAGIAIGLAFAALGCGADGRPPMVLRATYSGDYGFALEPSSAEWLATMLQPGEETRVVVAGESKALNDTAWNELPSSNRGPFPLEARAGESVRPLGELQLDAPSAPTCDSASNSEAPSPDLDADTEASLAATASCTHNYRYWRCINCQCKTGIYLKGWARRYICIYGVLYPENVYSCSCPFTAHGCAGSA